MKRFSTYFLPLFFLAHFLSACNFVQQKDSSETSSVKILDWNLQTFFDGSFDGNEYSEYSSSKAGWSQEKYAVRLERLAEVVKAVDPDVFVMQELEKEEQLYDIYNHLCSNFRISMNYSYGCFAKEDKAPIGVGVLSRFPLSKQELHGLDIRSLSSSQPSMRPMLKINVDVDGKTLVLFVNHWKSKSGGDESEIWRDFQESVLARAFINARKGGYAAIACGDFNRDISEFLLLSEPGNAFNVELRGRENIKVRSPWYNSDGALYSTGSYWYKGYWERIDHFFCGAGADISGFKVENSGCWAGAEGAPLKYIVRHGTGYSDHFPVSCVVSW